MKQEKKKPHFIKTDKPILLGDRWNASYQRWAYESCGSEDMDKFFLQIHRSRKSKDSNILNIIDDYVKNYDLHLRERITSIYRDKTRISATRYYLEEDGERVYIDASDSSSSPVTVMGTSDLATTVAGDLKEILPLRKKTASAKNHVCVIVPNHAGRLTTRAFPVRNRKFREENYAPAVRKAYTRTIENFKSKNPPGRLLLLKGLPGTGKTYFIRALAGSVEGDKIFVPSHMAASLSGPDLLKVLLEGQREGLSKQILIFEDAENLLLKRQADNSSFVSTVLNFADGFLAEVTNTYIVASTNISEEMSLDPAVLRPGRLMEKIEFPRLQPHQANKLYNSLTQKEGDFTAPATLARVYSRARGTVPTSAKQLRKAVGFTAGR